MALKSAQIEALANAIVHGAEEKYVTALTDALVKDLMDNVFCGGTQVRLEVLSKANKDHVQTILTTHREEISAEVMKQVQATLSASDAADVASLSSVYGTTIAKGTATIASMSNHFQELTYQTARGLSEIIARQNIALAASAEKIWYEVAGEAITALNHGMIPRDKLIAQAVARLSAAGITTIDYASGVSNQIDVAIKRHLVSQVSQAGGEMTLARLEQYGHKLVITSAHYGARPSHAAWQGKPCCTHGAQMIDGVMYPDLVELTGYGSVAGLKGVNCRHSIGPYFPGITKLPDLDFPIESEHFGMSSAEYFDATQRSRELERRIRATKRDIAVMEKAGLGLESPTYVQKRLLLGKQQQMLATHASTSGLIRQYSREKAYGVGAQPRALRTAPTIQHAKDQMVARGVTDKQVADAYAKPLHIGELKYNDKGEPSRQYIGRGATIAVNPDTGKVVTVWPTSSKRANKWKERGNYGKTESE